MALALLAGHVSVPAMLQMPAEQTGMDGCHDEMPAAAHHKQIPITAVCHACPAMAMLPAATLVHAAGWTASDYPPLSSDSAEGISLRLDPPPPRSAAYV